MSDIVLKRIKMTLDPDSIDKAIQQVIDFQTKLQYAMKEVINFLAEKGVMIVQVQLVKYNPIAVYTGRLNESIKAHKIQGKEAKPGQEAYIAIDEDSPAGQYAIYVEYGTGIYAKDGGKRHGEPWVYFNDNDHKWHMTYGMPPRPFMHDALRVLETAAEAEGAKLIARFIPKR